MKIKLEYSKRDLPRLVEFEGSEKEFYKFVKEFSVFESFKEHKTKKRTT